MPADITEDALEGNVSKALSLTGVNVVPNDFTHLPSYEEIR